MNLLPLKTGNFFLSLTLIMFTNHGQKWKICTELFIDRNNFGCGMTEGSVGEHVDSVPSA
jgi:hypothetical protein